MLSKFSKETIQDFDGNRAKYPDHKEMLLIALGTINARDIVEIIAPAENRRTAPIVPPLSSLADFQIQTEGERVYRK